MSTCIISESIYTTNMNASSPKIYFEFLKINYRDVQELSTGISV